MQTQSLCGPIRGRQGGEQGRELIGYPAGVQQLAVASLEGGGCSDFEMHSRTCGLAPSSFHQPRCTSPGQTWGWNVPALRLRGARAPQARSCSVPAAAPDTAKYTAAPPFRPLTALTWACRGRVVQVVEERLDLAGFRAQSSPSQDGLLQGHLEYLLRPPTRQAAKVGSVVWPRYCRRARRPAVVPPWQAR